jgi:hypothetical protein
MAKLKGKTGRQKVTVEHVHVHKGGQAIVGTVAATGPGPGDGTEIEHTSLGRSGDKAKKTILSSFVS